MTISMFVDKWLTQYRVLLTSIAISFINCLVLLFHTAGTVNIHAIESGLKASEHRSVSSSKIKYLRCRRASVNMRVAGRDALLAAIIWVSFEIIWKIIWCYETIIILIGVRILFVWVSTHLFVVQEHFELIKVIPSLRFFWMHVVEIITGCRSKWMEIEIRRQQQGCRYFLAIGYRVAFV